MTLYLFTQYALIVAIILIAVITISLAIKSWFDETTFAANVWLQNELSKQNLRSVFGTEEDSFDDHVESTPGMKMHTPN